MAVRRLAAALVSLFCALLWTLGCAEGHCRHPLAQPGEAKPLDTPADPAGAQKPGKSDTVFVYKYDGSLQCKAGKATLVETMAKELQGIPILSSSKKSDGLLHIQVCGSNSGMANVYEISASSLKAAESRGFKKWSFE